MTQDSNALRERLSQPVQHEPWCDSMTKLLLSMPPQIPSCNCKPKQQQQQEPVRWLDEQTGEVSRVARVGWTPLYTSPQPRQWVGLTDEELKRMWVEYRAAIPRYLCFARAIAAKLREKNA